MFANIYVVNMRFNKDNVLNPGIHEMTWDEFKSHFSFSPKRKELIKGLEEAIKILKEANCTDIYIDGSFVTSKLEPNDWDACFDCEPKYLPEVYRLYPFWDVQKQKKVYGGELYIKDNEADPYGTRFIDFFQQIRGTAKRKGIVRIKINEL